MLAKQEPDIIAFSVSYRGTGKSAPPEPDTSEAHNVPAHADDLLHLLQQAQKQLVPSNRLIVCAHSMSSKVTYELLRRLEVTAIKVTAIVLLAPAPPGPFELDEELRTVQLTAYQDIEHADWVVRNVLLLREHTEDQYQQVVADCVGMSPGAKRGWIDHGMAWSCIDTLKQLSNKPPVHVVIGGDDTAEAEDRVMNETVEVLRSHGFAVTTRLEPHCHHLIPVEAPDVVSGELRAFLQTAQG